MSDVPQARRRLNALAVQLKVNGFLVWSDEVMDINALLFRVPPSRPMTKGKSVPMTRLIAKAVCAYKDAHPNASNREMAALFNIDSARVSEALAGKW